MLLLFSNLLGNSLVFLDHHSFTMYNNLLPQSKIRQ